MNYLRKQKLLKLAASRPLLNKFDFIDRMEFIGFEYDKIAATYDEISGLMQLDDFSIYPEDDLLNLYKIDDMDIHEMIEHLCEKLEVNFPSTEQCEEAFQSNGENFDTVYILKLLHLEQADKTLN